MHSAHPSAQACCPCRSLSPNLAMVERESGSTATSRVHKVRAAHAHARSSSTSCGDPTARGLALFSYFLFRCAFRRLLCALLLAPFPRLVLSAGRSAGGGRRRRGWALAQTPRLRGDRRREPVADLILWPPIGQETTRARIQQRLEQRLAIVVGVEGAGRSLLRFDADGRNTPVVHITQ